MSATSWAWCSNVSLCLNALCLCYASLLRWPSSHFQLRSRVFHVSINGYILLRFWNQSQYPSFWACSRSLGSSGSYTTRKYRVWSLLSQPLSQQVMTGIGWQLWYVVQRDWNHARSNDMERLIVRPSQLYFPSNKCYLDTLRLCYKSINISEIPST